MKRGKYDNSLQHVDLPMSSYVQGTSIVEVTTTMKIALSKRKLTLTFILPLVLVTELGDLDLDRTDLLGSCLLLALMGLVSRCIEFLCPADFCGSCFVATERRSLLLSNKEQRTEQKHTLFRLFNASIFTLILCTSVKTTDFAPRQTLFSNILRKRGCKVACI